MYKIYMYVALSRTLVVERTKMLVYKQHILRLHNQITKNLMFEIDIKLN